MTLLGDKPVRNQSLIPGRGSIQTDSEAHPVTFIILHVILQHSPRRKHNILVRDNNSMVYRDIRHTRTNIFFGDNTFCDNKELTQPPDADNRSATKELPPYVQKVYP